MTSGRRPCNTHENRGPGTMAETQMIGMEGLLLPTLFCSSPLLAGEVSSESSSLTEGASDVPGSAPRPLSSDLQSLV